MPIYTPLLNLLKKVVGIDPPTDKFNIQTMMNDNWDKIDAAMALQGVDGDVRVATTANITLSGLQTVDGIVLAAGDRVLVKNQTTGSQNGIYVAASGAWTRAADADSSAKVAAGISVYVRAGTVNGAKVFSLSNAGAVTLGTTALTFIQTSGAGLDADTVDGMHASDFLTQPTIITTGQDLNNLTARGMYYSNSNSVSTSVLNSPTTNAFSLLVERHAGYKQTLTEYMNDGTARTWTRNYYSNVWGSWYRVWDGRAMGSGSGMNADMVDGYHLDQDVRTTATPSFKGITVQGSVGNITLASSGAGLGFSRADYNYIYASSVGGGLVFNVNGDTTSYPLSPLKLSADYSVKTKNNTLDDGNGVALFRRGSSTTEFLKLFTDDIYSTIEKSEGDSATGSILRLRIISGAGGTPVTVDALQLDGNGKVWTKNNTLDDGSGYASFKRMDAVSTSALLSVLSRSDSGTNAATEYRTTAGGVFVGNADGTSFGVAADANINGAKFKVNKNTGDVSSAGTFISTVGTAGGGKIHFSMRPSTGGGGRFQFGLIGDENNDNTGSNFALWAYNDAGNSVITALSINRSSGAAAFAGNVQAAGTILTTAGGAGTGSFTGTALIFNRASSNYFQASAAGGYLNFTVNGDSGTDANATLRLAADYSANFRSKVVAPMMTDGNSFKKLVGNVVFAASTANQKADIYFPASTPLSGYVDVTITGSWNVVNGIGRLTKRFTFVLSNSGTVSAQETRYTEAMGGVKSQIAISDLSWDSSNSRWRIQIAKIGTSTGAETFTVIVDGGATSSTHAASFMAAALGSVYTTDTTVFPAPKVTLPDLAASMVAKPTSISEFNVTSASLAQFLTASFVPAGNYNAMIYLRVTAATTVSVSVNYADATGAQSTVVVSAQAFTAGSYSLLPVFFNANANSNIILLASSSVSGAVKVSASILGV
ncbi:hypothetical protein [Cohnella sp. GCM10012308]|uniref:hypothetical protein n=1 Tax=Cohnella sp. GCM10012308 TaxID=3317329 RepID=UPI0036207639